MITDAHGSLAERAQQLSRMIPGPEHPDYHQAIHRWACALQHAIKQDRSTMALPDLDYRSMPIPTTTHDYSGQNKDVLFKEWMRQIEQRLENLEVLVRIQQDDLK